jgi:hypothetical protein
VNERLNVGILFPHRIRAERRQEGGNPFDRPTLWLIFEDAKGSRVRIGLSEEQCHVLTGLRPCDPQQMARDLYVSGHIEADEFERRLERAA